MENSSHLAKAQAIIQRAKEGKLPAEERPQQAGELAALMLLAAKERETSKESRIHKKLGQMMHDPIGKTFTSALADQCFRSHNSVRVANQLSFLLQRFGIPRYLSCHERSLLLITKKMGPLFPKIFVSLFQKKVRHESSTVIISGEEQALHQHMRLRNKEAIRINLNRLGEAILGEEEAAKKMELYLRDLEDPKIEYISVKISTLFSQIRLIAWEQSLNVLEERLKKLYRKAMQHFFTRKDGVRIPKFVNLDMEEYRDLHLTVALFCRVLESPEFLSLSAGIVLQSYLPDSYKIQQHLTEWAMERAKKGGSPIKIRIVKGANLAMEKVEASLHGWPQAPYQTKHEVDANYKRMITHALQPEHLRAVRIGVGSHNLFDIAYAILLAVESGLGSYVEFEMLEGMADSMCRVVQTLVGDILLYCPVARNHEFASAIAYLVRRLDENTTPENFLRHAFTMLPGTDEWKDQLDRFLSAHQNMDHVSNTRRRTQNRNIEAVKDPRRPFENEPDTDWSLKENRSWIEQILEETSSGPIGHVPCVINGKNLDATPQRGIGRDPSRPGMELYTFSLAEGDQIERALYCAENTRKEWQKVSVQERSDLLSRLADLMRSRRGVLIAAMIADGGKTLMEADGEISEAIDFVEYYRKNLEELSELADLAFTPLGTVLVAPPWNFPCSIPMGGIAAALAAGNCVIFKPAPESIYVAWILANLCWDAGFSRHVLQFVICADEPDGSRLVCDPRVHMVLLTGATETAKKMLNMRPGLSLIAETGGKNTLIITAMADRDLAVRDLVHSAFGHAGQKCSACSLAICEAEVYDDPQFRRSLRDAAASLKVGSSWELSTRINPLIRIPSTALKRALTTLEEGEEWLLQPKQDDQNPNLWSPGIKWGVKRGGFTHQTELFGPVLGVMRAENLDDALELANGTRYGLTAGIHSLDEREQHRWAEKIQAGNCYINRGITGAIVQRQPFGGCKESVFGNGGKAGGPNYLMHLMRIEQVSSPRDLETAPEWTAIMRKHLEKEGCRQEDLKVWDLSVGSYAYHWKHYFSLSHDPSRILGQDNFLKYVPKEQVLFRLHRSDRLLDQMRIVASACFCGTPLQVSGDAEEIKRLKGEWIKSAKQVEFIEEDAGELLKRMKAMPSIRSISLLTEELKKGFAQRGGVPLERAPLANGRIELFSFLREISLSIDYHRYGNLGLRENEARATIL